MRNKREIISRVALVGLTFMFLVLFAPVSLPRADAGGPPSPKYPTDTTIGSFPGLQFGERQCTGGWGAPQFISAFDQWSGFASGVSNFDPDCVRVYMDSNPIPANTDIRFCSQTQDGSYFVYGSGSGPVRCSPWISSLPATGGTIVTPWVTESDQYNPDAWKIKIEKRTMPNDGITSRSIADLRLGVQVADHLYWNSGCSEQVGTTRYTPYKTLGGGWSSPMAHDGVEHEDMNCVRYYLQTPVMISRLMPALTLAGPASVTSGDTAVLTYTIANASTCTLVGSNGDSWSGFAFSGTQTTSAISPPVTYTLTCTGPGGTNLKQHTIGGSCTVENVCVGNNVYSVDASCGQTLAQVCTNSCVAGACVADTSCTLDGITVPSGSFWTFYSQSSVPAGEKCSDYGQNRMCTNGTLSGDDAYNKSSCSDTSQDQVLITANGSATSTLARLEANVTIAWDGGNADSCTVTGTDGFVASGVIGSQVVVIKQKVIYTAVCTLGSNTRRGSVTVNLLPKTKEI